jgi:hypothetical protein
MRSPSTRCLVLLLGAALAGCGGDSPADPSPSLPALERLSIARQVVSIALGGLAPGAVATRSSEPVPLGSLTCEQVCSGATCQVTCPVNEQLDCPGGGSATDVGTVVGTLDANLTGEAAFEARQTYTNCRNESDVTINGDPDTRAAGTVRFVNGELAGEQTVAVSGAVRYQSSQESGRCEVSLQGTFTPEGSGSASGTACGEPVNVGF